jgi:NAD(P)-dependent dehydrogenase (short-subunit alcohol dehydrogenase family)
MLPPPKSSGAHAGSGRALRCGGCDVTDERKRRRDGRRGLQRSVRSKTLVNNAGAARAVSLQTTTPDDLARRQCAEPRGAVSLLQRGGRCMLKATQGSVINIASVNGMNVFGHPAYSAAKAGLLHFTKLVAVEYGKFGIRSNAIAPGTVRTQAWEARAAANPNVFEEARRWYPLQRVADPDDVANAVGFLASPQASAISGVCLPVDCGLTAGTGGARPHLLPIRRLLTY